MITAVPMRADWPSIDALEEKLLAARCRLLTREPWTGAMAMQMTWHPGDFPWQTDERAKTMGVRIVNGGEVQCIWYPGFVHRQSIRQLYGVIQHEIEHIVRCHCIRIGSHRCPERWNIACCKPDELIVGGRNVVISDLQTGDSVYGSTGAEVQVIQPMTRHYDGDMVQLTGRYLLPFSVTPEHPILVAPWRWRTLSNPKVTLRQYEEPRFVNAGDLVACTGSYGHPIKSGYALVMPKYIPAPHALTSISLESFILRACDGSIRTDELVLDDDMAWAMGMYVAEGSSVSSDNKTGFQYSLSSLEVEVATELQRIFGQYGFNPRIDVNEPNLRVHICSPIIARAFTEWFGRGALNKHLPEWLLHHSDRDFITSFLRGYFTGDGSNNDGENGGRIRNNASTVSRLLALQIQMLGFTHGIPIGVCLTKHSQRTIGTSVLQPSISYTIEANMWQARELFGQSAGRRRNYYYDDGLHVYLPLYDVNREIYCGPVYNVETSDHTYLVSNVIVHNCDMAVNCKQSKPAFGYHEPSTNEIILPLDGKCVFLPEDWELGQTTEALYDKLGGAPSSRCPRCGSGPGGGTTGKRRRSKKRKAPCPNCGSDGTSSQAAGDPGTYSYGGYSGEQIDDHDMWSQSDISAEEARQLIKDMTDQATAKCQGNSPGHLSEVLAELRKPIVRWRELLRTYIGQHVGNRRATYSRRNRRNDAFGLPGISHHAAATVVCIVDTSGSISTAELQQFFAEVELLASGCKVYILQWDHSFQGFSKYRRGDWKQLIIKGRGGTDMAAPINWLGTNHLVPDCVIMLTDGWCTFAAPQPWYPDKGYITVITTPKGTASQPGWGKIVYLRVNE